MTTLKRRSTFLKIIEENVGKPCPCCLEIQEFERQNAGGLHDTLKMFQKVFGVSVITMDSVVAFRIVPVPKAIEKRGEDFFYNPKNLFPSCCHECREEYQKLWLYHAGRVSFIEELVSSDTGGKKIKVIGGRIR